MTSKRKEPEPTCDTDADETFCGSSMKTLAQNISTSNWRIQFNRRRGKWPHIIAEYWLKPLVLESAADRETHVVMKGIESRFGVSARRVGDHVREHWEGFGVHPLSTEDLYVSWE